MAEQVIDGNNYRTGVLSAKEQFHLARRLAPIVADLGRETEGGLFASLARSLSKMSDEDVDYILRVCMSVVTRQQGERFSPVWNKAADQPMFADMSAGVLMQLAMAVVQDNLGNFMPAQAGSGPAELNSPFGVRLN